MTNGFDTLTFLRDNLMLILPLFLLQVGLMLYALINLIRTQRPTRGPKWMWALIILFVNILGPIAYLLFGREEA